MCPVPSLSVCSFATPLCYRQEHTMPPVGNQGERVRFVEELGHAQQGEHRLQATRYRRTSSSRNVAQPFGFAFVGGRRAHDGLGDGLYSAERSGRGLLCLVKPVRNDGLRGWSGRQTEDGSPSIAMTHCLQSRRRVDGPPNSPAALRESPAGRLTAGQLPTKVGRERLGSTRLERMALERVGS